MRTILIPLLLLVFTSPAYTATVYKWVDKNGVVNFTDDIDKIPPSYRDRVEKEERKDVKETVTPRSEEGIREEEPGAVKEADLYGRDEAWWREKVRPWKEKLKEATQKYEEAKRNYEKKADEVAQTNFAGRSRSQSKWDAMALNRLREEKEKYQAQITEANEMLEKLFREAEEAKADPGWLE